MKRANILNMALHLVLAEKTNWRLYSFATFKTLMNGEKYVP